MLQYLLLFALLLQIGELTQRDKRVPNDSSIIQPPADQCVSRDEVEAIVNVLQAQIQAVNESVTAKIQATVAQSQVETQMLISNEIQSLRDQMESVFRNGSFNNPALSCKYIPQGSPSGKYWIVNPATGNARLKYCDMTRRCNTAGGWMRVANLDMTDPNQQCPSGFRRVSSPRRICGRPSGGCVSTTFQTHGIEYSKVCGKIIGYQYGHPDAFHLPRTVSIDGNYVDGVSLTHGRSPRKHIWTFAAASGEIQNSINSNQRYGCPCTRTDIPFIFNIPSFVRQDYFCETGSRHHPRSILYTDDPLWNGRGCGSISTCCGFNNPPQFYKQLPQPTSDDIELRLCANEQHYREDVLIESVELYIQ